MNEKKWLEGTDPIDMLEYLRPMGSSRKFRLFSVACCWRVEPYLDGEDSCFAVQVGERYADGKATQDELEQARASKAGQVSYATVKPTAFAFQAAKYAVQAAADIVANVGGGSRREVNIEQCELLRCMFGNPFQKDPFILPHWKTWNNGTVTRLAHSIYQQKNFGHLPVLADALEEAGCDDETLLDHCRTTTVHTRGCYVLDTLLGMH
ncbi:MAG: hypothetical protein ACFCD0_25055 [Gemmataceae bacterium]